MKRTEWLDGRELAKIGFLVLLRATGLLRPLKVFPMLSGATFSEAEWERYAQLLGVAVGDLLNAAPFQHQPNHFAAATEFPEHDLFTDPGTGIADEGQETSKSHLSVNEVQSLLPLKSSRILVVFQCRPNHNYAATAGVVCAEGEVFRTAMWQKLARLNATGLDCFAYYDASVNFIVLSRSSERLAALLGALRGKLLMPKRRLISMDVEETKDQQVA